MLRGAPSPAILPGVAVGWRPQGVSEAGLACPRGRAQRPGGWHAAAALTGDLLCGELEEPALEEKYVEFAES